MIHVLMLALLSTGLAEDDSPTWLTLRLEEDDTHYALSFLDDSAADVVDFVELGSHVLGVPVKYHAAELASVRLKITGPLRVSRGGFRAFWEDVLDDLGFLVIARGTPEDSFLSIVRALPGGRGLLLEAPVIPFASLAAWKDRRTLVTTVIPLQHAEARGMMSALSSRFDNFVETIRNIEGSNQLVVTQRAHRLWDTVQIVAALDQPAVGPTWPLLRIQEVELRLVKLEDAMDER